MDGVICPDFITGLWFSNFWVRLMFGRNPLNMRPLKYALIITGRLSTEYNISKKWLLKNGIENQIYTNNYKFLGNNKRPTEMDSAYHKVLKCLEFKLEAFVESSPIQAWKIKSLLPNLHVFLYDIDKHYIHKITSSE